MKEQAFIVSGMSCAACSARVEKVVAALPGTQAVQVNLLTRSMKVSYDESRLSAAAIMAAVEQAGYGAQLAGGNETAARGDDKAIRRRLLGSFLFLLPMVVLHHSSGSSSSLLAQMLLLLPILWLNRKFFISGWQAALHRAPNMDTLIALGAGAGILYSLIDFTLLHQGAAYLESAGMILTLITLGKWMESRATRHTGAALEKLKALLPQTAVVQRGNKAETIPAEQVQAGDLLVLAAGCRIPVDAVVTEGISSIDESSLTGESMPVLKQKGDKVYAGSINGNGTLHAKASCTRSESTLSDIIHLVGEAAAAKAPIARLADRISGIFVPLVVGIAVLTAAIWLISGASLSFAMGCAIAVLVVSCPCALGLATPVAIMAGAGKGAENGILFRDATSMEQARRATAIILDKTGTITAGHPIVTAIIPAEGTSRQELLQLACTLEQSSTHPLAHAIRKATAGFRPESAAELEYIPGRGIVAEVGSAPCLAGNAELMSEHGICLPSAPDGTATPLYFARAGRYLGMFCVTDPVKADSAAAIACMQRAGLRVLMMSGDRESTVSTVAKQVGIQEYYAGVLPQDKEQKVCQLQLEGYCVAMVGDGINDSPALTRADVGIAIGAGTDVAIESAGIILVRSELKDAVAALKLSRAVIRTIRQNLFWAFFYNVLTIPLAAGLYYPLTGWLLSPGVAAAAMSLSSLFVVCNALRLRHCRLTLPPHSSIPTMNTITISVIGMMCPHCERHVTQALAALPGISEVKADHKSATVTLTCEGPADEATLAATVQQAGYEYKGMR